jgi:hypothetical protein
MFGSGVIHSRHWLPLMLAVTLSHNISGVSAVGQNCTALSVPVLASAVGAG